MCMVRAELQLPSIIADHMVLQQGEQVPLWGWTDPGAEVVVNFMGNKATTKADDAGKWVVHLESLEATYQPAQLRIQSRKNGQRETRVIENVVVGEVWVAGGQSNMWWRVKHCKNAEREIAQANDTLLRVWDANTHPKELGWRADTPQRTVKAEWASTSPKTVGGFPGPAFFFAQHLRKELDVPVGIIHVAVLGSPIERFMKRSWIAEACPQVLKDLKKKQEKYEKARKKYRNVKLPRWEKRKAKAEEKGEKVPKKPRRPKPPHNRPQVFFNGMIAPAAPYAVRGFLWWQGEANAGRAEQYTRLFPALIRGWRRIWNSPEAPFIFVGLHNYGPKQHEPVEKHAWPAMREAQVKTMKRVNNSWMISSIDIKEDSEKDWQIHPHNKQLAGNRLFKAAMQTTYGGDANGLCPVLHKVKFKEHQVMITFRYVGDGLEAGESTDGTYPNGSPLKGFAVRGKKQEWHWANAEIADRRRVVITCPDVSSPIAVRYNWASHPVGNLQSKAGLPALPLRAIKSQ